MAENGFDDSNHDFAPCVHGGSCGCYSHEQALAVHIKMTNEELTATLAQMRKDGQGLSHDQEQTIRRGLGLTLL